ncbi:hypothetical protein CPB86DRAFT_787387 [Serendipita vermifera]|nr:hypothetical protein CPB86DRAFT_787387 [Serendipita vermifera]
MRPVAPDLQRRLDGAGSTAPPINNNNKLAIGLGVGFAIFLVICVIGALWWFRGIRRNTENLHSSRKSHMVSGSSGNSRRKQAEQRTTNSEATLYGPGPPTISSREPPPPLPSPLPTATRTSRVSTPAATSPAKDVHPQQAIPLESISQMRPLAPPTFATPPAFEHHQAAVSPVPIIADNSHSTGMPGSPHMQRLEPREGRRSSEDMNDLITMLDNGPAGSRTRPPSYRSHESKAKSIRPLSGESSLSAIPYTIPVPMPPIPYEIYDRKKSLEERPEEEYEMAGSDTASLRSRSATSRGGGHMIPSVYSFGESSYITSPGASSSSGSTRRGPSLVAKGMFTTNPAVYAPVNRHSVAPKGSHQPKAQQQQQQQQQPEVPSVTSTQPSPSLPQDIESSSKTVPIPYGGEVTKGAHSIAQTADGRPGMTTPTEQLETPLGPLSAHPETKDSRRASIRDGDGLESGWF